MKIISKYQDYYDPIQRYGYDDTVTFIRKEKEILINYEKFSNETTKIMAPVFFKRYEINFFIIGFCGNLFPAINIYSKEETQNVIFYNEEKLLTYINRHKALKNLFDKDNRKYLTQHIFSKRKLTKERINHFFNCKFDLLNSDDLIGYLQKIFEDYKVPYFLYQFNFDHRQFNLILNPALKNYKFQTVKDPYTAYQEIGQYISGVLGNKEINIRNISDEDMKYKKGFNDWSFKKEKHQRKKRK